MGGGFAKLGVVAVHVFKLVIIIDISHGPGLLVELDFLLDLGYRCYDNLTRLASFLSLVPPNTSMI